MPFLTQLHAFFYGVPLLCQNVTALCQLKHITDPPADTEEAIRRLFAVLQREKRALEKEKADRERAAKEQADKEKKEEKKEERKEEKKEEKKKEENKPEEKKEKDEQKEEQDMRLEREKSYVQVS